MKCITVTQFGQVDDIIKFSNDFPKPILKKGSKQMLVRVLACSTSPGDWRTMSGSVDGVRKPKCPYIPSQDICGIVEEIDGESTKFKIGDCIVGTWFFGAYGGMAEYCLIDLNLATHKPPNVTPVEAAALANSAVNAMLAVRDAQIKEGHRVLILGGSGGVGTMAIQFSRLAGASFIASTSSDTKLLESLKVDQAIDYHKQNWWEIAEFGKQPFDAIIDCGEGIDAWYHAKDLKLLKSGWNGGIFLAVVADNPSFEVHSKFQALREFIPIMLGRPLWTKICSPLVPKFQMLFGAPRNDSLSELFEYVKEDKIKVILDPSSPFSFTEEGAKEAFRLQASRHAHGKIVIEIASEDLKSSNDNK